MYGWKVVHIILCVFYLFRVLTKEEIVIEGLSSGWDAALEVRQEGIAGRGVFATSRIEKGSWPKPQGSSTVLR